MIGGAAGHRELEEAVSMRRRHCDDAGGDPALGCRPTPASRSEVLLGGGQHHTTIYCGITDADH
jgi:hypothetical protein